ncbi:MAG TPA: MFS transporter [Burkholderiaceae bacterium]|nr:MFS transporter [Burkholderiaceae bacterium]
MSAILNPTAGAGIAAAPGVGIDAANAAFRKVTWRLIPFLFLCYVLAFLDRINIGFAQLQMKQDLAFSDVIYGLGAGIFFIGYLLFEVPSNLMLQKVGARKTILRIMVGWGLVSAATMFVTTPTQFYIARFLLGVFEAGFFPGIILYLTYWYPSSRRGRIIALFMTATAVAGLVGGPLSGWIMKDMAGVNGWAGWQWMFLLEGLPSVLLGVVAYFFLTDKPSDAKWLTASEKQILNHELGADQKKAPATQHSLRGVFRDPKVYLLAAVYFTILVGGYALSFWVPTMIRALGVDNVLHIGLYAAIPYLVAVIAMVWWGRHSDATLERRWHCVVAMLVCGAALVLSTLVAGNFWLSIVLLCFAAAGAAAVTPVFWTIPSAYLTPAAAAAGIALVSSLGSIAGFVSPFVIGSIKAATGSLTYAMYFVAAMLVLGAVLILKGVPAKSLQEKAAH